MLFLEWKMNTWQTHCLQVEGEYMIDALFRMEDEYMTDALSQTRCLEVEDEYVIDALSRSGRWIHDRYAVEVEGLYMKNALSSNGRWLNTWQTDFLEVAGDKWQMLCLEIEGNIPERRAV